MTRAWTLDGLAMVWAAAKGGADLRQIADLVGRQAREIDQALWNLLGRSPQQALAVLNAKATEPAPPILSTPQSSALFNFQREAFG